MKKKKISLAFIVLCIVFASAVFVSAEYNSRKYAENVLRFHVIANSNTMQDQALKLKVRDAVGIKVSELSQNSLSADEMAAVVAEHSVEIIETAEKCIKEAGYDYKVKIEIGEFYFPTKHYSGMSLPAGEYEAVRVVIGEGCGENWWCVLFPPLCFSNGNAVESFEDSGAENEKITVKFKITEVFQEIKHGVKNIYQKIFK